MIVQRLDRDGKVARLVTQRDHALLSGSLARAWDVRLSEDALDAIDRHDDPWQAEDREVRIDTAGWVYDFITLPLAIRLPLYAAGLDAMGDTYAALLTSIHYEKLMEAKAPSSWLARESARQARLTPMLSARGGELRHELDWLRFFDVLSLYLCMTPPGVAVGELPSWLRPKAISRDPEGHRFVPEWVDGERVVLRGAPMREVTFSMPSREVRWAGEAAHVEAGSVLRLTVVAGT